MKTLGRILFALITFVVLAVVICVLGRKYDIEHFSYMPIALSCMYSFFVTLVYVGGYWFMRAIR